MYCGIGGLGWRTPGLYCCWWPYAWIGGVSIYMVMNKLDNPSTGIPGAEQY